jgi:peptidoglycan hydrolase-like protein with peptidoglycan-binding domain
VFLNKKISLGFILLILAIALVAINTAYSANNVFIFNKNLTLGNVNNDVKQLQIYLNNNGYILAKTGPGSKGKETTKFGSATKASLIKFQKVNKIKPSVGYFGPITRDFINKKIIILALITIITTKLITLTPIILILLLIIFILAVAVYLVIL